MDLRLTVIVRRRDAGLLAGILAASGIPTPSHDLRELVGSERLLRDPDRRLVIEVAQKDDILDSLYDAIKRYVMKITNQGLSEEESRRASEVLSFSINDRKYLVMTHAESQTLPGIPSSHSSRMRMLGRGSDGMRENFLRIS